MSKGKQTANLSKIAGELNLATLTEGLDIPKSITFMGRIIPIEIKVLSEDLDGQFCGKELKAYISPGLQPVEQKDTVLHELFHGIDQLLYLNLSERQIRLLATALVGMFQDNPEFASYITENFKDKHIQATSK